MATWIFIVTLLVVMVAPSLLHFGWKLSGKQMKKVLGIDVTAFAMVMLISIVCISTGSVSAAPETVSDATGWGYLAAALVTGLAAIGAGIAVASSASAAIGAISEDSSVMGKALIFVALAEGIALYGLLVSFTIIGRL